MSVFVDVVNAVVNLTNEIIDYFYTYIYDQLTKFTAYFIKEYYIGLIKFKLFALKFSWDVAQELITSLNISVFLSSSWSSLDPRIMQIFVFFKIPEAVNIIISSGVTKFVFRFLGF